ncbi:hypothetical protein AAUPMC_20711, partial [Pasteurella multocida subsp. multocida str. Anand1_cattle]
RSAQIEQFVQANSKTSYAVLALLEKAKVEVEKKEFAQAEQSLKQALAQSTDENLSSITALRLASVQYQQQAFDMALDSLKQVKESSWDSRKNLLIGDILLAKGDKVAAKASYQQALNNASPLEAQWLQVRLNNFINLLERLGRYFPKPFFFLFFCLTQGMFRVNKLFVLMKMLIMFVSGGIAQSALF